MANDKYRQIFDQIAATTDDIVRLVHTVAQTPADVAGGVDHSACYRDRAVALADLGAGGVIDFQPNAADYGY